MMLFIVVTALLAAVDGHTYLRKDPLTGQELECEKCPPGFRLGAHCTRSRQTECVPCGAGLFTEFWNYIPNCLLCDACADHQRVVRPCSATENTVCECKQGFYWDQHFCRKHSRCKQGHAVKAAGTPDRDTECEACGEGQYTKIRQGEPVCVPHSVCQTHEHLLLPGSAWHDSICGSCQQLEEKRWADVLSPVLSGLQHQDSTQLVKRVNHRLRKRLHKRAPRRLELAQEQMTERFVNNVRRAQQHCSNALSR